MAQTVLPDNIESRHYINGVFSCSSDGKTFPLKSPYSHNHITDVSEASVDDTNRAVAAAKAAFPTWSNFDVPTRGTFMKRMANLIREAEYELAQLDALSMGRPVSTYFDAKYAAAQMDHYAEAGWEARGITSLNTPGYVNMTFRQPFGPVAIIIPWNIPVAMWASRVAPALAAGCTVVLKSSEKAPLSSAKLALLAHRAGFPPGVINVLSGHGTPCGTTLASHMDIRVINFTGSSVTGRAVQTAATSSNLKKVILELGGKSPTLIFDDADVDTVAADTTTSVLFNSGQTCMAGTRIYVQESIAETFMSAFVKLFSAAQKGDPLLQSTEMGPQADEIQFERIKAYIAAARSETTGALLTGGRASHEAGDGGYFIEPTAYCHVSEDAKTQREEIFGPFVNINTFRTESEAIEKANATEYGLYASVYTKDLSRALRVAKAFESGFVAVNCTSPTSPQDMPFGGYKCSGQGREGLGHSLLEYLECKSVVIKLEETATNEN